MGADVRLTLALAVVSVFFLQACATGGTDVSAADAAPVEYVPEQGLSEKDRFRRVLFLLGDGQPVPARAELELYLQAQPDSEVGRDLLAQIDAPIDTYFPAEYRSVELLPGYSLSTLSKIYLGSIYRFHALARYNGISEPHKLTAGQVIRIPLTARAKAAFAEETADADQATEAAPEAPEPVPTLLPVEEEADPAQEVVEELAEEVEAPAADEPAAAPAPAVQEALEAEARVPSVARVETLHRDALNAYRAQDLDRAIALWDEVLQMDSSHENARLYRAQAVELKKKLSNLL